MIALDEFTPAWEHLCARFGKEPDARQSAAYYGFLSERMETDEFLRAARTLWATAKWFPRPADFLGLGASDDWQLVLNSAAAYNPPDASWHEHWKQLSPRGAAAARQLGGISAIKPLYDRDVIRLRSAFLEAYEAVAVQDVLAAPLPQKRVTAGESRSPQLRPAPSSGLTRLQVAAPAPPGGARG